MPSPAGSRRCSGSGSGPAARCRPPRTTRSSPTTAGCRWASSTPGSRVAVPRHVPAPLASAELPEPEIILLAHLIGDGSFVRRQPLRYASTDEACLAAVTEAARHFGITAVRDDYPAARCTTLRLPAPYQLTHGKRNPVAAWLDGLGLFGLRSHEKFVPEPVFSLPKRQVRLFLRHLWATDGCVWWDAGRSARPASTTPRPAGGSSMTSPSFCCGSASDPAQGDRARPATGRAISCCVYGAENQLRFLRRHRRAWCARGPGQRVPGHAAISRAQHEPRHHPARGLAPGPRACWPSGR